MTPARPKKSKVTGLKLTGLTVPLFPDKEAEIREYGAELARYLNFELDKKQREHFDKGVTIKAGKWLNYSNGVADMLRRWASALPEPSPRMLREIAKCAEDICLHDARIAAPVRGRRIDLIMRLELDIPTAEAGIAYVMATVLSAGYGENLKQCQKHDCDIWFFDVPEGRRARAYCCTDHSNAERQRRSRRKAKLKKRRRIK